MHSVTLAQTPITHSRVGYGAMGFGRDRSQSPAEQFRATTAALAAAVESGITLIDTADFYHDGLAEELLGAAMKETGLRDRLVVQTKVGIRPANDPVAGAPLRFDNGRAYIVQATEASLRRLGVDVIDILLLHQSDVLAEPEEIAAAFDRLQSGGKVRTFGVSNHSAGQMELLRALGGVQIVANQLQFSLGHLNLLEEGMLVNKDVGPDQFTGFGTLEYCRLHRICVQAWSPTLGGSMTPTRMEAGAAGADLTLSHEQWYRLLASYRTRPLLGWRAG